MLNIRASLLPSYCDCPRRAATRLIRQEIVDAGYVLAETPQSIGALVGSAFHAGAALTIGGIYQGISVSPGDAIDMCISRLRADITSPDKRTEWDTTTPRPNDAEQQVITMLRIFHADFAPSIRPAIPPETRRNAALSSEVTITGATDLESESAEITDYKTGRLRNYYGQLGVYSLLRKTASGESAAGLRIIHFPRVPVKKPYPGPVEYWYPVELCERTAWSIVKYLLRDIREYHRTGSPDEFMANPMSQVCSAKYCPAWGSGWCEMGGRR